MGNLVLNCIPVVPSEGTKKKGDRDWDSDASSYDSPPMLMSVMENIHETPTTIHEVLSSALFAVAFHQHLALT